MTTEQLQTHLDRYPSRRDFCRELLTAADIEPTREAVEAMEQILSHQLRRGSVPKAWGVAYRIFFKLQNHIEMSKTTTTVSTGRREIEIRYQLDLSSEGLDKARDHQNPLAVSGKDWQHRDQFGGWIEFSPNMLEAQGQIPAVGYGEHGPYQAEAGRGGLTREEIETFWANFRERFAV